MKIEIGESLIYSWLRHIKKCEVVQNNWKTSPEWMCAENDELFQLKMNRANAELNNPFKKTKDLNQLFKQAEIDALGINVQENSIYAVDVAFHEGGLSYGDKHETAKRVTKKILRTSLILKYYFPNIQKAYIYFVSPKINPEPLSYLQESISKIREFLINENIECEVLLICNNAFRSEILNPIKKLAGSVADTSELFLRSVQLINMLDAPQNNAQNNQEDDGRASEINKVISRVPRWFNNPTQINARILLSYLELSDENTIVTREMLEDKCESINDFNGNYNQMKSFGNNNHGKVFSENNSLVM